MSVYIGTSGWRYRHWVGPFYPKALPAQDMLGFYSREFGAVEINSSFYGQPDERTLADWRGATPDRFRFAFKANRYITHMKKLKDVGEALDKMITGARVLGDKLGPVLLQLPPRWRVDTRRLEAFLSEFPADLAIAFEFRDASWFTDEVYEKLRRRRAAFCIYDLGGKKSPCAVTSDVVYVRLHGPDDVYVGSYGTEDLGRWAGAISTWDREGRDVWCFFNNDEHGYAVQNARELKRLLE